MVYVYAPQTEDQVAQDEGKGVFRTEREVLLSVLCKDEPEPRYVHGRLMSDCH